MERFRLSAHGHRCNQSRDRGVGKGHIRGHAGTEFAFTIVQAHLDAEDLLDALPHRLDVGRGELGGAGDLFHHPGERLAGVGIDAHRQLLTELDMAQPRNSPRPGASTPPPRPRIKPNWVCTRLEHSSGPGKPSLRYLAMEFVGLSPAN